MVEENQHSTTQSRTPTNNVRVPFGDRLCRPDDCDAMSFVNPVLVIDTLAKLFNRKGIIGIAHYNRIESIWRGTRPRPLLISVSLWNQSDDMETLVARREKKLEKAVKSRQASSAWPSPGCQPHHGELGFQRVHFNSSSFSDRGSE